MLIIEMFISSTLFDSIIFSKTELFRVENIARFQKVAHPENKKLTQIGI